MLSRVEEKKARVGGEFGGFSKLIVKSSSPFISLACSAISSSKTNFIVTAIEYRGDRPLADQKRFGQNGVGCRSLVTWLA